jgi:hypothetical protein
MVALLHGVVQVRGVVVRRGAVGPKDRFQKKDAESSESDRRAGKPGPAIVVTTCFIKQAVKSSVCVCISWCAVQWTLGV